MKRALRLTRSSAVPGRPATTSTKKSAKKSAKKTKKAAAAPAAVPAAPVAVPARRARTRRAYFISSEDEEDARGSSDDGDGDGSWITGDGQDLRAGGKGKGKGKGAGKGKGKEKAPAAVPAAPVNSPAAVQGKPAAMSARKSGKKADSPAKQEPIAWSATNHRLDKIMLAGVKAHKLFGEKFQARGGKGNKNKAIAEFEKDTGLPWDACARRRAELFKLFKKFNSKVTKATSRSGSGAVNDLESLDAFSELPPCYTEIRDQYAMYPAQGGGGKAKGSAAAGPLKYRDTLSSEVDGSMVFTVLDEGEVEDISKRLEDQRTNPAQWSARYVTNNSTKLSATSIKVARGLYGVPDDQGPSAGRKGRVVAALVAKMTEKETEVKKENAAKNGSPTSGIDMLSAAAVLTVGDNATGMPGGSGGGEGAEAASSGASSSSSRAASSSSGVIRTISVDDDDEDEDEDNSDEELNEVDPFKKDLKSIVPAIGKRKTGSNSTKAPLSPSDKLKPGSAALHRHKAGKMMDGVTSFFGNKDGGSGGARQTEAAEAKANAEIVASNATIYNTFTALAAGAPDEATRILFQAKADAAMALMMK